MKFMSQFISDKSIFKCMLHFITDKGTYKMNFNSRSDFLFHKVLGNKTSCDKEE